MSKPHVYDNKPIKKLLEKGKTYQWCSCGKSNNQPLCDGSHMGSGLVPKRFEVEQTGEAFICMCKHTKNPPYCDGTHKEFN